MPAITPSNDGATGKIVLLVAVIVVAIAIATIFYLRSGAPTGTVEKETQQMPPGVRGHKGHGRAPG